jgi:SAM-dependent methyltransferase
MPKLTVKFVIKKVVAKFVSPKSLIKLIKILKKKKRHKKAKTDTTLKLYSRIFPGDFLHFGYYKNIDHNPEDMSINDINRGQLNYAEMLINEITDNESEVLDVGCGMGGLIGLLLKKKCKPVGLTPDLFQLKYIKEKYPHTKILNCKFEQIPEDEYRNHFGTVITSESLQYLKLKKSVPIMESILKPGGNWIISDYFELKPSSIKSGFYLDTFWKHIDDSKWETVKQVNFTPHILPFLSYCYMWVNRIFLPLLEHILENFQNKRPGAYYLFEDVIEVLRAKLIKRTNYVNPEVFSQNRKYMLTVLKRK